MPDQKVVLWDEQTCPKATLCYPILSHLLPPARVWLLLLCLKLLFRRLRKWKLTLYLGWISFSNHFKVWDSWRLPASLYHAREKCLLVKVIKLSWSAFFTLITLYSDGCYIAQTSRISTQRVQLLDLSWSRSHQIADGNNHPAAFAGLNCRKYLHSCYCLTKTIRTSWIHPRVLSISSELSAFSSLLPATAATMLTYGAFIRPREEPTFGKHPTRVLTDKDEDPTHEHHRLEEESQHIKSVGWPGELLQLSGLLKIQANQGSTVIWLSPLRERKLRIRLGPRKTHKVPKAWQFKQSCSGGVGWKARAHIS